MCTCPDDATSPSPQPRESRRQDSPGAGVPSCAPLTPQQRLDLAEARFQTLFEHSAEGIFLAGPDGAYLRVNPALVSIFGYPSAEALMEALSLFNAANQADPSGREDFAETLAASGRSLCHQSQIRRPDGSVAWISESAWKVLDESGNLLYYEGLVQDITQHKRAEDLQHKQAFHDALTGLPNRQLFMDRLEWALRRSQRRAGYRFAVLMLDLDRFKVVNDSLGHQAGDSMLLEVARRLSATLRPMDTVARLGGDEFAVLADDITGALEATRIISRLQEELSRPFSIQGREVFTSASIGVVLKTWGYDRPEHIIRDADTAMYRAKALGKARSEFFDPSMHQAAASLLQTETDLRQAVERGQLRLHYQPIVDIGSGRLQGFEALVRWQHPRRGLIQPGDFIPLAEETGLIGAIGTWVLRTACEQLLRWQRLRPCDPPLWMSVNLSAKQFMSMELVAEIRHILEQTGVPPESLKLEITETKVMENAESASRMLESLKGLGVKISVDDFGTGYSSLAYLQRFPLDSLKIDRSFVSRMCGGEDNAKIVGAIVNLAHNLGLEVVAEGVEQHDQLEHLQTLACRFGQGFLFSRPVPAEEAEALLLSGDVRALFSRP